ncbi:MAG: DNA primase [Deltaproteobacteria bacterium]|nr:DNA primase [Deltaproteobacteria bacterium]
MARIPDDAIAEIRSRVDIVQIVGQHVQLRRSGANHKGLCPFHEEKTPSFNVNSERQFYHCFGCNESGDVFSFLMKVEGRRFDEVVEELAARVGVEIQPLDQDQARQAQKRRSEREQGLRLNARVAKFYREILLSERGREAREYLAQRGISDRISEAFLLGFAPDSGLLVQKLRQADVDLVFAERLGLIAQRRGRSFDRFWGRLIFPLLGARGEVLGFGGRILRGDGPKYINTPETPLYRKGEALYGLHLAATAIRQRQQVILVEGNIDVLQLHEHGFDNAVAPMGTALTESQVRLCCRFSNKIIGVFDGDDAGRAAAQRAAQTMLAGGAEPRFASLPDGTDPDSLLCRHGAPFFAEIIDKSLPAVDYLLADYLKEMEDTVPGRARVLERIAPLVGRLDSAVARDLYVDKLSMSLAIDRSVVSRAVKDGQGGPVAVDVRQIEDSELAPYKARLDRYELEPLLIMVEHPRLAPWAEEMDVNSLLTNDELRATYSAAFEMQRETGEVDSAKLLQKTPTAIRSLIAAALMSRRYAADGDPARALEDCLAGLRRRVVEQEFQRVRRAMEQAQQRQDQTSLGQLRTRLTELIDERRRIGVPR